jgi:pimeloyl-ACP methyl ester carboxylesterase
VPPPGELIDVGGHRLHAVCRGDGRPAVILEAGIAASSLSWARVLPELAAFTRACAYDRAGLAWSEPATSPRTFARILDDLDALIGAVAVTPPVILVGHSFGSLIIRGFAARHPERVAGLVLVDPPMEWIVEGAPSRTRLLRGARQLSGVGALLARVGVVRAALSLLSSGRPGAPRLFVRIFGPTAARTLERLVGEVRKLPPDLHPVVQALWCQPKCFHAMRDYLAVLEIEAAVIAAAAPPRDIPVVVISGAHQAAAEVERHEQLAAASARGRHVIAAKGAHWIPFDEPEVIVGAVRTLLGS